MAAAILVDVILNPTNSGEESSENVVESVATRSFAFAQDDKRRLLRLRFAMTGKRTYEKTGRIITIFPRLQ